MSEGCWFFTLKIIIQFPGTEIRLRRDFLQTHRVLKSKNRQYLGLESKIDKSKVTLFSKTCKVSENNVLLLF